MRRTVLTTSALTLLALTAARALVGQPHGFGETVEVELVLVDALVTDRAGRPILDLAREEFQLFEDGEPVAIGQFSPPTANLGGTSAATAEAPSAPGPSPPSARRAEAERLVIFLDQLHLKPTSRVSSLQQLYTVLDARLNEETEVMVASFDGTAQVVLPPTRDRKRLLKVLTEQARYGSQALVLEVGERQILHTLEQALEVEIGVQRLGCDMEQACTSVGHLARSYAQQVYGRVEQTALALREFTASLAAYPGRKTLLYVSDGFPLVAGQEAYDVLISWCDGSVGLQGPDPHDDFLECGIAPIFSTSARLELQSFDTAERWNQEAAEANSHRVTFYTLQALGLTAPRASDVDEVRTTLAIETAARFNNQDPLFAMAEETGGRAILNAVHLHIPFRNLTLLPEGETSKGLLTVFVGARDERGAALPVGKRALPLAVSATDLDEEFLYTVELPLLRGHDWEIAVALRDELAGETSYVTRSVRLTKD